MEKKLLRITLINGLIVAIIVLFDFLFLRDIPSLFSSIMIVAGIMFILPIALIRYYEISRIRVLEEFFPQFMRDLVESIKAGMTLPQAIESVSDNDYGGLSPHVKRLNAQLNWGVPFSEALMRFSKNTKSKLIGRITSTIIESHEVGGNLIDVFESISSTSFEIEKLREERELYINSQLMTGYIIFFIFLFVIIVLQRFLVPMLSEVSVAGLTTRTAQDMSSEFVSVFRNLIILQGLFAGLVIGKMSGGSIAGGIKHSLFLIIVGVLVFTIFTL
jgi:flagellar protein FlaJ